MSEDLRSKDADWWIRKDEKGIPIGGIPAAQLAVLMDIRDELKRLNDLLYMRPQDTPNVVEFFKDTEREKHS